MMTTSKTGSGPVEAKVIAGTAGSAAGGTIGAFVLWLLDEYAFKHGGVPGPVTAFTLLIITTALTLGAAYWAPHTFRLDLTAGDGESTDSGGTAVTLGRR